MIACVDVDYRADVAVAGCVTFQDWEADVAAGEFVAYVRNAAEYESGQFYKRELPCLLTVLQKLDETPRAVVVDGYVWLKEGRPGLGAHLFRALAERIPVIGVAKTKFAGATDCVEVFRSASVRPLMVSAAGIPVEEAARCVRSMAGDSRIPILLKRVDRLCRDAVVTNDT